MGETRPFWGGAKVLPPDKTVYRAVLRERYIKNGIRAANFIRRPSDVEGLSINDPLSCAQEKLCSTFVECYGVLTLHVSDIRSLGLDARPDDVHDPKLLCDHGNIIGVPYQADDEARAEFLATALVEKVSEVWRP